MNFFLTLIDPVRISCDHQLTRLYQNLRKTRIASYCAKAQNVATIVLRNTLLFEISVVLSVWCK